MARRFNGDEGHRPVMPVKNPSLVRSLAPAKGTEATAVSTQQLLAPHGGDGPPGSRMAQSSRELEFRGFAIAEILADYQLALVSRFLDDREITLQKQSRRFFHISGAGHEALGLGFSRSLRPGYDWFLPYYRDRSMALALGITPTRLLLQAVGRPLTPLPGAARCRAISRLASSTSLLNRARPVPSAYRL